MNSSDFRHHRPRAAFTLIELMITVTLIALLATLALVAMNHANTVSKRNKASAHLKTIESALEQYASEEGSYPRPKEGGEGQDVVVGSMSYPGGGAIALYQALSGDGDSQIEGGEAGSQGIPKSLADSKVYWGALDATNDEQGIIHQHNGQYMLVDPWGAPWQYRMAPRADANNADEAEQNRAKYHNLAKYDLWSYAGDTTNQNAWIKNW